jgi:Uma2 family endonuclease
MKPEPYEEIIQGESMLRFAPGERHEYVCERLHALVNACLDNVTTTRLLAPRSVIQLATGTLLRPDLTLVTAATSKAWLIVEVVDKDDHQVDTVLKKEIYEQLKLPRLWMVDPRYNNVEIYHGTQYGLVLKHILAGKEMLSETLLPTLQVAVRDLFKE